ncbi:hypothetical protein LINPERHAP1_LOCUS8075 [Linum perenne]
MCIGQNSGFDLVDSLIDSGLIPRGPQCLRHVFGYVI